MTLYIGMVLLLKVYPKWEGSIWVTDKIDTPMSLRVNPHLMKTNCEIPSKCYPTIFPSNLFNPSNSELFFFKTEK